MKNERRGAADRDLMLFLDDELDAEQRTDVQVRLDGDRDARRKLAAMRLVGDLVRESALADVSVADGIAGSVMSRIAAEPKTQDEATDAARDKGTERTERTNVVSMRDAAKAKSHEQDMGAAKRIYAAAAVAVAIAAGFMVWGKLDATGPVASNPISTSPERLVEPPARDVAPPPSAANNAPTPDRDVEMGVEVAAVDFGAGHGSVFYVPDDGAGKTTTVVWLDDSAGGEQ